MRFASIDIGSNAIRLLLCNVFETGGEPIFKKAELVRMPLRLGEDAFRFKKITDRKYEQLLKIMRAYRLLIDAFEVIDFKACATSAMREAENSREIIEKIKKHAGIEIELIDGKTEAQIIYSNHIAEHLEPNKSYLYIDVGGGSTELTLFSDNHVVHSQSFNVGTIRLLQDQVSKEVWQNFKEWIKEKTAGYSQITAIGSGGNINKIIKMMGRKESKPVNFEMLKAMYEHLQSFTYEERITQLGLNPDRADVIIPAVKIFITILKTAGIEQVLVPQVGLSDGIIHLLYEKHRKMPEIFPGS